MSFNNDPEKERQRVRNAYKFGLAFSDDELKEAVLTIIALMVLVIWMMKR